jgi:hypothetical protein
MNDKLFEMEGKQPVFLVTEEDLNNFALRIIDGVREVVEDALGGKSSRQNEDLISAEEVLARLKVSKSTLWRWEKQQYLTPVKLGRKNTIVPAIYKGLKDNMYTSDDWYSLLLSSFIGCRH